ncbi:MAG: single-stranded DNA-binding protein [Bacteroidales bacterium]|nr:single-stranded DNA-binding protein [Bacteroidales bacterium]
MAGINKVILVGRLGRDPEVKTINSGAKYARFTIATSETFKGKDGEKKEVTEWHNIVCWRKLADIAEQYLTKGKLVYLEGRLTTRTWEDNGAKKYMTEIVADTFNMLSPKSGESAEPVVEQKEDKGGLPEITEEDGDLPF